ncbi:MAG: redoxin domain-containing protein [Chlorobi bacterium]|nr:redoxin domain-containing protein [Chlorobiota bacterium]
MKLSLAPAVGGIYFERVMRYFLLVVMFCVVFIPGCGNRNEQDEGVPFDPEFEGIGRAPDFPKGLTWFNTDGPRTLEDYQGRIVLLEFWTSGSIECLRLQEELRLFREELGEVTTVIGIHSGRFAGARDDRAVRDAIARYRIRYPVVNDTGGVISVRYNVASQPAFVVVNPEGRIVLVWPASKGFTFLVDFITRLAEYFERQGGLSPGETPLTAAEPEPDGLYFPGKLAIGRNGKVLYVSNSGRDEVLIVDVRGGVVVQRIGAGRGFRNGRYHEARFNNPQGLIAVGDSLLYLCDAGNHAIRVIDLRAKRVTTLVGNGRRAVLFNMRGSGSDIGLNSPWGITAVRSMLYVTMPGAHQVWRVNRGSGYAEPYVGFGVEGMSDGSGPRALLAQPLGIFALNRKLYFVDGLSSAIREIEPSGKRVVTLAGFDVVTSGYRDGGLSEALFQHPSGVAGRKSKLYITDSFNHAVRVIDLKRKTVRTLAGGMEPGFRDGRGRRSRFRNPQDISVHGRFGWVADTDNHAIRRVDLRTGDVTTLRVRF